MSDNWLKDALDYADEWVRENKEFAEAALRSWGHNPKIEDDTHDDR